MMAPPPEYKVVTYGNDAESIIIMDDFTETFTALHDAARSCQYTFNGGFYPGIQAAGNMNYIAPRSDLLFKALKDVFGYSGGFRVESCAFSMVAKPAETLHAMQRIPHHDAQDDKLFALLHYVQGPQNSGTAFYRHRRTGFETITPARAQEYDKALAADLHEFGPPKAGYIDGNTLGYEMLLNIDAKPNRAILYRGRTLHSGIIPKSLPLTPDPMRGRITLNTFIWAA